MKTPTRTAAQIVFSSKIDQITDQFIYELLITEMQAAIYALNRAVTSITTNDHLRDVITRHMLSHISDYINFMNYGKLKGWSKIQPAYKTEKDVVQEPITVSEANNIWDHLNERYDHLQLTDFYLVFIHDVEFRKILEAGLLTLSSQIAKLEKLAIKFEIPLPPRPPVHQQAKIDPEVMEDSFVYRRFFTGVQLSIGLHLRGIIESARNNDVQMMFVDFLKQN